MELFLITALLNFKIYHTKQVIQNVNNNNLALSSLVENVLQKYNFTVF